MINSVAHTDATSSCVPTPHSIVCWPRQIKVLYHSCPQFFVTADRTTLDNFTSTRDYSKMVVIIQQLK